LWGVHDSIELEKRGIPTVTYVADVFLDLADYESESRGFIGLPVAVVLFPMGGVSEEEAYRRSDAVFESIVKGLTNEPVRKTDNQSTVTVDRPL
jgi:phosphoglycerate dehydrogenase-like enzyme